MPANPGSPDRNPELRWTSRRATLPSPRSFRSSSRNGLSMTSSRRSASSRDLAPRDRAFARLIATTVFTQSRLASSRPQHVSRKTAAGAPRASRANPARRRRSVFVAPDAAARRDFARGRPMPRRQVGKAFRQSRQRRVAAGERERRRTPCLARQCRVDRSRLATVAMEPRLRSDGGTQDRASISRRNRRSI